jgi:peptide-methionine (S)-S-oxide reductase
MAITALLTPAVGARTAPDPREAVAYFAGGCFLGDGSRLRARARRSVGHVGLLTIQLDAGAVAVAACVESVRITYDPSKVSYHSLLDVFFLIAHDPTTRDRQGPISGRNIGQ